MASEKYIDQANRLGGFYGDLEVGSCPALLVVDFQKGFTQPRLSTLAGEFDDAINATRSIISNVRGKMPIIFTICGYRSQLEAGRWIEKCSALEDLILGTEACELDPRLPVNLESGDLLIFKQMPSAFFGTSLCSTLNFIGVDTVFIAGCTTSGCVRASVVDALQCGFGPFVIEDACADRSVTQHESNLVDMESKYAQLVSSEELIELALARI